MTGNRAMRFFLSTILMTIAFVAGSESATAAEERWECCLLLGDMRDPFCVSLDSYSAAMLTADRTNSTGTVNIGGIVIAEAKFMIDGTSRIWGWKDEHESPRLVMMKLNGVTQFISIPPGKKAADAKIEHSFKCRKR